MHRRRLKALLNAYRRRWPQEAATVALFDAFVDSHPDCFHRSCRVGHITGSAWLVDMAGDRVLLAHHAKLGRWLQPGGHSDGDPDTLTVALREAREESGLDVRALEDAVFDIDVHGIPARGRERAFRSLKTVDLKVRPIYHYAGARVRAHVFLCMLAYYVEWHMRQRLKPLLFDDEEPDVAEAARPSVVAPAEVSPSAQNKARRKRTVSGERVHSFRTLLDDLATVANNRVVAPLADAKPFDLITRPTALQRKAFKLLGVRLERTQ